jgi:hypothetical protein
VGLTRCDGEKLPGRRGIVLKVSAGTNEGAVGRKILIRPEAINQNNDEDCVKFTMSSRKNWHFSQCSEFTLFVVLAYRSSRNQDPFLWGIIEYFVQQRKISVGGDGWVAGGGRTVEITQIRD